MALPSLDVRLKCIRRMEGIRVVSAAIRTRSKRESIEKLVVRFELEACRYYLLPSFKPTKTVPFSPVHVKLARRSAHLSAILVPVDTEMRDIPAAQIDRDRCERETSADGQ